MTSGGTLTKKQLWDAKPKRKPFKLFDGAQGLFVLVTPGGSKLWRMKYRLNGKERLLALGEFPGVDLPKARADARAARIQLDDGLDPVVQKKVAAAKAAVVRAETFGALTTEWLATMRPKWSSAHYLAQKRFLETDLGALSKIPLVDITPPMLLAQLKIVHKRAPEMAAKCRRAASMALDYAVATGQLKHNPAVRLARALPVPKAVPRPTLPPDQLHKLFAAISKTPSEPATRAAFAWLAASSTRSQETRGATWGEISADRKTWSIPGERMKMDRAHDVVITDLMRECLDVAGGSGEPDELVFKGFSRSGALSENAFLALIARAGYFGTQTGHGLRAAFSTWAHDNDFDSLVIELALAHGDPDKVRAVYNRSKRDAKRKELAEAWSAFLESAGIRKLLTPPPSADRP